MQKLAEGCLISVQFLCLFPFPYYFYVMTAQGLDSGLEMKWKVEVFRIVVLFSKLHL